MRRSASDILRNLERRVARLERKSSNRRTASKGRTLVIQALAANLLVRNDRHAASILSQRFDAMMDNWSDMGQSRYERYMAKEIAAGAVEEEWDDNNTDDKSWQEKYFNFYIKSQSDAEMWVAEEIEEQLEDGLFR